MSHIDSDRDRPHSPLQSVYSQLRADLISGYLAPSRKLPLSSLTDRYGTSMGPVREALSRLDAEGLVVKKGQRGYWAADLSIEEFTEMARLRLLLETDALTESIAHGDMDWESSVVSAMHRVRSVLKRIQIAPSGQDVTPIELIKENRAFHMALIAGCPSQRQIDLISSLYDQSERMRHCFEVSAEGIQHELAEHQRLMDAALSRRSEEACHLLKQHIEQYGARVAAALR